MLVVFRGIDRFAAIGHGQAQFRQRESMRVFVQPDRHPIGKARVNFTKCSLRYKRQRGQRDDAERDVGNVKPESIGIAPIEHVFFSTMTNAIGGPLSKWSVVSYLSFEQGGACRISR